MDKKEKPLIKLSDPKIVLFELVRYAQEVHKGKLFGELMMSAEKDHLCFKEVPYQPAQYIGEKGQPDQIKDFELGEPVIFEHFLQFCRLKHPGVSFQFLNVIQTEKWFHLEKVEEAEQIGKASMVAA